MRTFTAVVLMGGLAIAAGCAEGTLSPQERSEALPMQADEFARLGYRVEWRGFATLLPGGTSQTLDLLGDAVGTVDSSGVFTVLDARSGSMRWSDQPSGPLTRFYGAIRDGNQILLGSETDTYVYDAATGTLNGKLHMPRVVSTKPTKAGEILVFGTPSGTIVSVLQASGFPGWTNGLRGGVEFDPVRFGTSNTLAIGSAQGDVLIVDGVTGTGSGRAKVFGGPGAPMAASETVVFVASRDHSLYGIARETGQVLWQHRTDAPLRHAPAFHDGRVYCDLGREGLCALEAGTGKKLWMAPEVHGDVIAVRKGKLVVLDEEQGRLVDPNKGAIVDTVKLAGFSLFKPEKFADGAVYALSPMGVVTKLAPK